MPPVAPMIPPQPSALLTDLYQLNMMQAYLDAGMTETAVFEFFVRKLPAQRGFLMAAGLAQVVDFLLNFRFTEPELRWLAESRRFRSDMLDYLAALRFTGDVHAMAEGTVFFPNEPILRVTAPLPLAQLVETRIINLLHFESLIASKAARMVLAAPGKTLIDFGLRRAHGAEAGLLAARASYLAGFSGSATTPAAALYGVPVFGTMAHSFIQAHDSEAAAFEAFARARPENVVLLVDTYDTEAAVRKVVALAPKLRDQGIAVQGIRLDSGDLADLAHKSRQILDAGGLRSVQIYASGGLDESKLQEFFANATPIDGFGIGTSLTTSSDAPSLDCAFKLQEYKGRARRKLSPGKATWPGRKQVFRSYGEDGVMAGDVLTLEGDAQNGELLIHPVLQAGKRVEAPPSLSDSRAWAAKQLAALPVTLRGLEGRMPDPVTVSKVLMDLAASVDRQIGRHSADI